MGRQLRFPPGQVFEEAIEVGGTSENGLQAIQCAVDLAGTRLVDDLPRRA